MSQNDRFPAPSYLQHILVPNYDLMRERFLDSMIWLNKAHVIMLARTGIMASETASDILSALDHIEAPRDGSQVISPEVEDLYFVIEQQVEAGAGEAAGDMHLALSRNDFDAAMFRMTLREDLLHIGQALTALRQAVASLAERNMESVMIAYTHNQQAQPTTLAHYLSGIEAHLTRDMQRLEALYGRVNQSPMGAAALGTTGFPIDRQLTAELLGFEQVMDSSFDCIGAADHFLEFASTCANMVTTVSRLIADFLFWTSNENPLLQLPRGFIQISSIMPQKRNPVALEHLRSMTERLMGSVSAVSRLPLKVPFGDIEDIGTEIQPGLADTAAKTQLIIEVMAQVVDGAQFNRELAEERLHQGLTPVTELADTLARDFDLPFRRAHQVVSRFVDQLTASSRSLASASAEDVNQVASELGLELKLDEEAYQQAIDPHEFVRRRAVTGGPNPTVMTQFWQAHRQDMDAAQGWLAGRRQDLTTARKQCFSSQV